MCSCIIEIIKRDEEKRKQKVASDQVLYCLLLGLTLAQNLL